MKPATLLTAEFLAPLIDEAAQAPRRRKNLNLHATTEEPAQRFFNAMRPESYARPHRHCDAGKEETLIVVQGRLGVLIFDDAGDVLQSACLAPGSAAFGLHVPLGIWHSCVALASDTVFLEIKGGPYIPFNPTDFAPWAPAEGDAAVPAYLAAMRQRVECAA